MSQEVALWGLEQESSRSAAAAASLLARPCFVLCTDAQGRAGGGGGGTHDFPWTLLLLKMLKRGKAVVLLSANHSREHYELILRRHGLDAQKLELAGLLKIHIVSFGVCARWDEMLDCVFSSTATSHQGGKMCLFIDDLEALEAIASSGKPARAFMARIFAKLHPGCIGEGTTTYSDNTLEILVAYGRNTDTTLEEYDGEPALSEFCKHRAHVLVQVQPLSSGRSHDAHGLVSIAYPWMKGRADGDEERYTFKIGGGSDAIQFSLSG